MTPIPPDSEERVFLRVIEAGSLKGAAERLGQDPSNVSRRLSALEERLGQRLLHRSTRGSRPTEAGARYYEGLARLVEEQDALEASIAGASDRPQGVLRVTAPPEFGVRFVVPPLEDVQRKYPELQVAVSLGTGFSDLDVEDIDVAIRIGTPRDSALVARKLGAVARVLVAAPSYLERHGAVDDLEDLGNHRLLGYRAAATPTVLEGKAPDGSSRQVRIRPAFVVNSMPTLVRKVIAGDGILHGPLWAVRDALASGQVCQLLQEYRFVAAPLHAIYRDRRYLPAKVRVFIETMAEYVASEEALER